MKVNIYIDSVSKWGMVTEKETITEKIERWKALAEIFLKEDTRVAIFDVNDNYFFADILFVGEEKIRIECFAPEKKKGLKYDVYWYNVLRFDKYVVGGK